MKLNQQKENHIYIELKNNNQKELVYNLKENRWYQLGEIPFEAPCGHALLATDTNIYSIMGEIKPAERKPYIHRTKK